MYLFPLQVNYQEEYTTDTQCTVLDAISVYTNDTLHQVIPIHSRSYINNDNNALTIEGLTPNTAYCISIRGTASLPDGILKQGPLYITNNAIYTIDGTSLPTVTSGILSNPTLSLVLIVILGSALALCILLAIMTGICAVGRKCRKRK